MRNSIGLDISKETIDATAIIGEREDYRKFKNSLEGHDELKEWIETFQAEQINICMEATGNYYEDVAGKLSEAYKVYVINPLKISKYAESRLNRTKTDKRDSLIIAEYLQSLKQKELHEYIAPDRETAKLKRLTAFYAQIQKDITAHKNRLAVSKDETVSAVCLSIISQLQKHLKQVKKQIEELTQENKTAGHLRTIPSIGNLTAAIIFQYLTTNEFKTANQLAAFAGLNPQQKESGTSVKGKGTITPYGNRKLRAALFMPAMVAYKNNIFPEFIERLSKKGKPKKVIIIAIMRKLLVIAFNLYTKGEDYDKNRYTRKA